MKVINVYDQYFAAQCVYNEVERRAAQVMLIASSEEGTIRYEAAVNFFPHRDEEDYAVSGDAYASRELYYAKGRRSKKREQELLPLRKCDDFFRKMIIVCGYDPPRFTHDGMLEVQ